MPDPVSLGGGGVSWPAPSGVGHRVGALAKRLVGDGAGSCVCVVCVVGGDGAVCCVCVVGGDGDSAVCCVCVVGGDGDGAGCCVCVVGGDGDGAGSCVCMCACGQDHGHARCHGVARGHVPARLPAHVPPLAREATVQGRAGPGRAGHRPAVGTCGPAAHRAPCRVLASGLATLTASLNTPAPRPAPLPAHALLSVRKCWRTTPRSASVPARP